MKKQFLISAALLISGAVCAAQTTPRWIRHSSISPDGEQIAFSYQGDIFTVSSKGGQARQITSNSAFDSEPMWSADGQKIVFVSYRELSKDIYVTSAQGGTPRRLTSFSGNETLLAVTPDGYALFSANAQQDASYDGFPGTAQLYRVSLEGGAASQVTSLTISNISINADGTANTRYDWQDGIAYQNPRTAVGYYEPGHYCYVVVDGRQDNYSAGMRFSELSELMIDMGCRCAYNLDGGGSAQMYFDGRIISSPSNGNPRPLGDILYVCEPTGREEIG
mgnify:CR=1 FL=1